MGGARAGRALDKAVVRTLELQDDLLDLRINLTGLMDYWRAGVEVRTLQTVLFHGHWGLGTEGAGRNGRMLGGEGDEY